MIAYDRLVYLGIVGTVFLVLFSIAIWVKDRMEKENGG